MTPREQLVGATPLPRPAPVPDPLRALAAALAWRIEAVTPMRVDREAATVRPGGER